MPYSYTKATIPSDWLTAPSLMGIDPLALEILAARGVKTVQEAKEMLFPVFKQVVENTNLKDMDKVVEKLAQAVNEKLPITVYQDYDVDGCMACAIMVENLRRFGAEVNFYGNDRLVDGYGMCPNGVDMLMKRFPQTKIILTVDNGIVAFDGIKRANDLGLTVLVTDHHEPGQELPPAYAVVDPKRKDEIYPFHDLCGAGIALKTMFALSKKLRRDLNFITQSADMAALATVADVVPMAGENRAIVKYGLKLINDGVRPAFRVMSSVKDIVHITAHETLAFTYAPMINAVSRMGGDTDRIVNMFLSNDISRLERDVLWLDELNERRKNETKREMEFADESIQKKGLAPGVSPGSIVVYHPDFQEGIVGIVAGRLKETYQCPAVVFAPAGNGLIKASARSMPGLDIKAALDSMADIMVNYGGHAMAAGITIQEKDYQEFCDRFEKIVDCDMDVTKNVEVTPIDVVIPAQDLSEETVRGLSVLEPFGEGFREPLVGLIANVDSVRYMGSEQQHVKYTDSAAGVSIITWGGAEAARKRSTYPKKFVGHVSLNEFNGRVSVQMITDN